MLRPESARSSTGDGGREFKIHTASSSLMMVQCETSRAASAAAAASDSAAPTSQRRCDGLPASQREKKCAKSVGTSRPRDCEEEGKDGSCAGLGTFGGCLAPEK